MRILYLGNNWVGWQVLRWLKDQGEEVAGLVLHPPERRKFGPELLTAADLPPETIFDGSRLREDAVRDAVVSLKADIGISVFFGYILQPDLFNSFPQGAINLHPSLLPHCRGVYPNVWSIVDRTPAGATLHYIDEGIDSGPIIAQQAVSVEPTDTGETLYRDLERACVDLFKTAWPEFKANPAALAVQPDVPGTYHHSSDVDAIDEIDLDRRYTGREFIDILRARTFPPHGGAYFRVGDRKVYLQLSLNYGNEP